MQKKLPKLSQTMIHSENILGYIVEEEPADGLKMGGGASCHVEGGRALSAPLAPPGKIGLIDLPKSAPHPALQTFGPPSLRSIQPNLPEFLMSKKLAVKKKPVTGLAL